MLGARTLFGSIFGLSATDALLAALIAAGIVAVLLAIARPLLFASVDPAVAAALGLLLLALLGATTAEATQAIGALLLLGLLAAPAGAAQRLTANPYHALGLSAGLAVLSTWAGLTLSYLIPKLPPSSAIIAVAAGVYLLAFLATSELRQVGTRRLLAVIRPAENSTKTDGQERHRELGRARCNTSSPRLSTTPAPPAGRCSNCSTPRPAPSRRSRSKMRSASSSGRSAAPVSTASSTNSNASTSSKRSRSARRWPATNPSAPAKATTTTTTTPCDNCDNCDTVTAFTDPDLETAIKNLERRVPMRVAEHEIVLHGACDDCSD